MAKFENVCILQNFLEIKEEKIVNFFLTVMQKMKSIKGLL